MGPGGWDGRGAWLLGIIHGDCGQAVESGLAGRKREVGKRALTGRGWGWLLFGWEFFGLYLRPGCYL